MKIVRIVTELDFGGVEQVLANSIPQLIQQNGIEIKILVLGRGGKVSDQLLNQGIAIHTLAANPRIPNFLLLIRLSKILFHIRPDVVHTQGSEANFHGILAAKLIGIPQIIGEEIGIPNHHSYWKLIFRLVYRRANQVIAISNAVKQAIVRLGEVSEEKVKVVYNPVKLVQSSEFRVPSSFRCDFVFITTCRLVPIKNLDRLIQAFAELVKENLWRKIILRIVGDGPERENLERKSREQEIGNRIEFLGYQKDVWPFLMEADAFVLPSLREGSSVSLVEAMAVGLPSIVTQVGGASEILSDSQSGFLINPLDTNSIQSAMEQMLDLSKEERQAMGERAKKEAQRFSVDNYIKELIKIYQSPIS